LYDAFLPIKTNLSALYTQYEARPSIRKRIVPAMDLFSMLMQERAGTGRIYIQNVDHCNTHSPFNPAVAPVRQSNLCLEIALPTKPLDNVNDPEGEIALCTLSAFNLGKIESMDDIEEWAELAVRALDALLDYQDYPIEARAKPR
jgi:ribonucleoside-diphosphate reductase alpha chain